MPFKILSPIFQSVSRKQALRDSENAFRSQQRWMFDNYNSPSAQSAAMRRAGLNPIGAVKPNVVGGSMPSVPPSSPFNFDLGETIRNFADIKNINADTDLKREQARGQWFDNITKETDSEYRAAVIEAELERLRQEAKKSGAEGEEARLRAEMLQAFVDAGGNVYQDTHDLNESIKALNLTQKEYVDVQKALGELNYELTDKYERIRQKSVAMMSVEELKQTRQAVQEFLTTSDFRRELVKLGVDEKRADVVSTNIANALDKIELNTLRNLVGDGGTWKDIPTAIFKKYFGNFD